MQPNFGTKIQWVQRKLDIAGTAIEMHFVVFSLRNPKSFERSSPSYFRTESSFIHINSGKIFERDLLSSDSVAKSATQKPWVL